MILLCIQSYWDKARNKASNDLYEIQDKDEIERYNTQKHIRGKVNNGDKVYNSLGKTYTIND